jgi:hypothetical protein
MMYQIAAQVHNPEPGTIGPDVIYDDGSAYKVEYTDGQNATIVLDYGVIIVPTLSKYEVEEA